MLSCRPRTPSRHPKTNFPILFQPDSPSNHAETLSPCFNLKPGPDPSSAASEIRRISPVLAVMSRKTLLKPQQQRAIIELLQQPTKWAAARAADVPERTLRDWLNQPYFVDALREAQRRCSDEAFAEIEGTAQMAVQTLRDVMGNVNAAPGSRVRAARTALELAARSRYLRSLHGPADDDVDVKASSQPVLPAAE